MRKLKIFSGFHEKWERELSRETHKNVCIVSKFMFIYENLLREGSGTPLQYSCLENPMDRGAWQAAVHGVTKSQTRLSDFTFTFHFHALEKEMATHSSVPAWRIPGTAEPGVLPSMGSHKVGHDWSDLAAWKFTEYLLHLAQSISVNEQDRISFLMELPWYEMWQWCEFSLDFSDREFLFSCCY